MVFLHLHTGVANPAENKHILAISTGPDHPASYDPILADAISDFFSSDWKQKTLNDFHGHIQVYMYMCVYICIYVYMHMYVCMYVPYGGKLWRWETLANLANDRGFAKFIPAKFYPVKVSLT